jgi:2',3'-cyclic-nucleotide 2'-phosphodiesterase (5'-nucleotidase family)
MPIKPFTHIALLCALLAACAPRYLEHTTKHQLYTVKVADSAVSGKDFLASYRMKMQAIMDVEVGYSDTALQKAKPDGSLGHLVCDAMLQAARIKEPNTDASICNYGGIRVPSMAKGKVTLGTVYEVMPFDNEIVVLSLSGALMDSLCQQIARGGGMPVAGIQLLMAKNKATQIKINGSELLYNRTYLLAVSDYMANGGDNMSIFKDAQRINSNILLRDAIVTYIKQQSSSKKSLWQTPHKRILN